ncbi:hypothetical protein ACFQZ4_49460 [Catellatospora coxensis]
MVGGEDVDLGVRACDRGYRWLTCARAAVLHQRDSAGRWSQVLAKQFTYGRADVFLCSRHRHRRTWRANPVTTSLMIMMFAVAGVRVGLPLWTLLAGAVPVLAALLRTGPQPVRRWGGALVDLAFDAGITFEAVRQRRRRWPCAPSSTPTTGSSGRAGPQREPEPMYAVGLCVDTAYLLPSLVTLLSLADATPDRASAAVRVLTPICPAPTRP